MVALVAALALLGAACGGGSGSEQGQVLPFERVQASAFVFQADPNTPGQVIFRMKTNEPMTCSIAWGETRALGHFNNDRNMAGTGNRRAQRGAPVGPAGRPILLPGAGIDG